MRDDPIFLLACSPRSGSTWLQRVLTSTNDVFVWGENTALCLSDMWTPNEETEVNKNNPFSMYAFQQKRTNMWMAVVQPRRSSCWRATKMFIDNLYVEDTEFLGFDRWGMKQTTWNREGVDFLMSAYPQCKVIFLARKFEHSFNSRFKHNTTVQSVSRAQDVFGFCNAWVTQSQIALSYEHHPNCRIVKYEDLITRQDCLLSLLEWAGVGSPNWEECNAPISVSSFQREDSIPLEDFALVGPHRAKIDNILQRLGYTTIQERLDP